MWRPKHLKLLKEAVPPADRGQNGEGEGSAQMTRELPTSPCRGTGWGPGSACLARRRPCGGHGPRASGSCKHSRTFPARPLPSPSPCVPVWGHFPSMGAPSVAAAPYVGRDARDCLLTRFDTLWRVKRSDPSSVVLPVEPVSLSQRVSHRTSFRDTFRTD